MIKTLIVDDESQSRNTLRKLIARHTKDINVVSEANNVVSAVEKIKKEKPELIFLDISMPDGSGFDAIEKCIDQQFEVIFTTAYNEYAIKAIRHNAIDYLLKPISISELRAATERVCNKIMSATNTDMHVSNMLNVSTVNGHKFIDIACVLYLSAKGAYTEIYCEDGSVYTCSHNLKHYEAILPPKYFFRSHNSYLINLSFVKYLSKGDTGHIVMADNSNVLLARRKKKEFLSKFF